MHKSDANFKLERHPLLWIWRVRERQERPLLGFGRDLKLWHAHIMSEEGSSVVKNRSVSTVESPQGRKWDQIRSQGLGGRISSARAPEMCPFEKQSKNIKTVRRKLAAIFAADVAGYSRLMARDA